MSRELREKLKELENCLAEVAGDPEDDPGPWNLERSRRVQDALDAAFDLVDECNNHLLFCDGQAAEEAVLEKTKEHGWPQAQMAEKRGDG